MEKTIEYLDGNVIYTGQVVDQDDWHGHGNIKQLDDRGKVKEEYNGDFNHGSRHGKGILIMYNANTKYTYKGNWVNDFKEGIGTETVEKNGFLQYTYEGNFLQDKRYGDGIQINEHGFTYSGIWNNNKLMDGKLIYEDIEILFIWKTDRYIINGVHNPSFRTIDINLLLLDTILDFDNVRILTLDMYYLIGFLESPTYIKKFIDDINTRQCSVRLVALCHATLLSGFPLPIQTLQRISNVPNGICNFDNLQNKIDILDLQTIQDDHEYVQQIEETFMTDLKKKCKMNPKLFENGDAYLETCKTITTIPNKTMVYNQPILNKLFSANESKVCLLLLYNDRGEYINLFSLQPTFSLQNILKRISKCSKCIFVDLSCSPKEEDIVHKQLQYMGGKRKTKRKNKK
jgi:hypothetical protein